MPDFSRQNWPGDQRLSSRVPFWPHEPGVQARLDRNFFDVRLDRISDGERLFLRTMADCSTGDGTCDFTCVAERLGKTTNALSMQRRALIRKGIIYAPKIGKLAYTVPRFGDYLKRTLPLARA